MGKDPMENSAASRFSLQELRRIYDELTRNKRVDSSNQSLVVEILRVIAEMVVYGDNKSEMLFDFFCEKNILALLVEIMWNTDTPPSIEEYNPMTTSTGSANSGGGAFCQGFVGCPISVHIQILQTLSILISCVKNDTSLYYLLSNNHINEILVFPHDWDACDESLGAQYASFMKSLSLRLNAQTVQFFFIEETGAFPLLAKAIELLPARDPMIRISAQTTILNVLQVGEQRSREYALQQETMRMLFYAMVSIMKTQVSVLEGHSEAYHRAATAFAASMRSKRRESLESPVNRAETAFEDAATIVDDWLFYVQDLLSMGITPLETALVSYISKHFIGDILLSTMVSVHRDLSPEEFIDAIVPMDGTAESSHHSLIAAAPHILSDDRFCSERASKFETHGGSVRAGTAAYYLFKLVRIVSSPIMRQAVLLQMCHPFSKSSPDSKHICSPRQRHRASDAGAFSHSNSCNISDLQEILKTKANEDVVHNTDIVIEHEEKSLTEGEVISSDREVSDEVAQTNSYRNSLKYVLHCRDQRVSLLILYTLNTLLTGVESRDNPRPFSLSSASIVETIGAQELSQGCISSDAANCASTDALRKNCFLQAVCVLPTLIDDPELCPALQKMVMSDASVELPTVEHSSLSQMVCSDEMFAYFNTYVRPLSGGPLVSVVDDMLSLLSATDDLCLTAQQVAAHCILNVISMLQTPMIPPPPPLPYDPSADMDDGPAPATESEAADDSQSDPLAGEIFLEEVEHHSWRVKTLQSLEKRLEQVSKSMAEAVIRRAESHFSEALAIVLSEEMRRIEGRSWRACFSRMSTDRALMYPTVTDYPRSLPSIDFEIPVSQVERIRREVQVFLLVYSLLLHVRKLLTTATSENGRVIRQASSLMEWEEPLELFSLLSNIDSLWSFCESVIVPKDLHHGSHYSMARKRFVDVLVAPPPQVAALEEPVPAKTGFLSAFGRRLSGGGSRSPIKPTPVTETPPPPTKLLIVQHSELFLVVRPCVADGRSHFEIQSVAPLLYTDAKADLADPKKFSIMVRSWIPQPGLFSAEPDLESENADDEQNNRMKSASRRPRESFLRPIERSCMHMLSLTASSESYCTLAVSHIENQRKKLFASHLNALIEWFRTI